MLISIAGSYFQSFDSSQEFSIKIWLLFSEHLFTLFYFSFQKIFDSALFYAWGLGVCSELKLMYIY